MKLLNYQTSSLNFFEYLISYGNILILLFLLIINIDNKIYLTESNKNEND